MTVDCRSIISNCLFTKQIAEFGGKDLLNTEKGDEQHQCHDTGNMACCLICQKFMLSFTLISYFYHYYFSATIGGSVAVSDHHSWWGAQGYCRTYHTDLAGTNILLNADLQKWALLLGTSWIGLIRSTWVWSDLSKYSSLQWSPGCPNNIDHNDNCASVNNSLLMDRQCNSLFYFFCHTRESFGFWLLLQVFFERCTTSCRKSSQKALKILHFVLVLPVLWSTAYKVRKQVVRLQVQGDESVFVPAVQSAVLQQVSS